MICQKKPLWRYSKMTSMQIVSCFFVLLAYQTSTFCCFWHFLPCFDSQCWHIIPYKYVWIHVAIFEYIHVYIEKERERDSMRVVSSLESRFCCLQFLTGSPPRGRRWKSSMPFDFHRLLGCTRSAGIQGTTPQKLLGIEPMDVLDWISLFLHRGVAVHRQKQFWHFFEKKTYQSYAYQY